MKTVEKSFVSCEYINQVIHRMNKNWQPKKINAILSVR